MRVSQLTKAATSPLKSSWHTSSACLSHFFCAHRRRHVPHTHTHTLSTTTTSTGHYEFNIQLPTVESSDYGYKSGEDYKSYKDSEVRYILGILLLG